jgi:hypothetical protein
MKKLYRKKSFLPAIAGLLLISVPWARAQSPAPPPQTGAAGATAPQTSSPAPDKPTTPPAGTQQQKISPKEAEELFRDVDQIMQFASKETGFPIKKEVKRRLVNQDEVVAYLQKNMAEDKDAQRLRRSELVLKKFGLLPRDFDLQTFLVALLREQVAGYYDPKTKTVNLLDWIDSEQQRPVLAHELTHALQDQSFGLEKWMKAGDTDLNDKKQPTPADIENDEIGEARQAVVEGQAMVVLVDYMLAPMDQSIVTSPQIADALKEGMLLGSSDSPEFKDAPIFLKEELTFPYRYGLDFETELLRAGGKEKAFASAFSDPPRTTRQIMEPKTYFSGEQIEPMRLPDFQRDFKNYERFDVGAIGEFDVAVLVDQYAGKEASDKLYPHWRGGYYYAARPKGDPAAPLSLLYVSRWSSPEKAFAFADIYAQSLAKRYKHVTEMTQEATNVSDNPQKLVVVTGPRTWMTEEGPIVIDVEADSVLITESLDPATTDRLREELFGTFVALGK